MQIPVKLENLPNIFKECLINELEHSTNSFQQTKALAQSCSVKKVYLEISQENTSARVSFLIKLQFFQKRDSGTGVFL